jgi:phospholipid-binding lipoprotein MlaA
MPARPASLAIALLAAALLSACAGRQPPAPDYDPWEPLNRKTFWLNDKLDVYALEPAARGWDYVMPDPVQRAISRFFNNLRFPIIFANDLLQGKPRAAVEALARFQVNTFIGGLGFFDIAADYGGLKPQDEDTGQTLGVWNISPGPYLVLPFFGPSNPRDTVGLAGDFALGFYTYFVPIPYVTIGASAVDIVNQRARFLDEVENAKEASLDFYTFVRNAYVQRRWKLVREALGEGSVGEEDDLYNEEIYEDYLEEGDRE